METALETRNEYAGLETNRRSTLILLEIDYPENEKLLNRSDIINLSFINAALVTAEKMEENLQNKHAMLFELREEQSKLVEKIVRLIAVNNINDAFRHQNEIAAQQGIDAYAHLLEELSYLLPEIYTKTSERSAENIWEEHDGVEEKPLDYKLVSQELGERLGNGAATKEELIIAMKMAITVTGMPARKVISEQVIHILKGNNSPGEIEKLLQLIHHGEADTLAGAIEEQRPILEKISDRPWEVANALTFVFAGYPSLTKVKYNNHILKWITPFRQFPLIRDYFDNKAIDIRMLEGATKTIQKDRNGKEIIKADEFLQASLSLAKELPLTAAIVDSEFFMDPYTADNTIRNTKE